MKKLIVLFVSLFLLVSCQTPSQPEEKPTPTPTSDLKDGTYEGKGSGFNGPLTISTTIKDGKIDSVELTENFESFGVQRAIDQLLKEIVDHQTRKLDVIGGATFASVGILKAMDESLKAASASEDQFSEPYHRGTLDKEEYTADVVVVGAGGSGLAAAVSAHQKGASVIVLEKLGFTGGSTIFSGGAYNAADPERATLTPMTDSNLHTIKKLLDKEPHDEYEKKLQDIVSKQLDDFLAGKHEGLFDSVEFHALQTYSGGDYQGNPALIDVMTNNALDGVNWLASLGAKWKDKLGSATGSLWQRSHYGIDKEFPNGAPEILPTTEYIKDHDGIDLHLYTRATDLLMDGSKVVGVKADNKGKTITYHAKSVVLATGGFGSNVEMRQKYNTQWKNLDATIGCSNQNPSAQGDGITLGLQAKAQLVDMGLIQLHPNGEEKTGMMMGQPHTSGLNRIFVNNLGKRFVAEDSRRDVLVNAIYDQPDGNMWIIADGNRYPEGDPKIANYVLLGKTFKADSVEELAKMIGVDAKNLQESIDQYNAVVDGAADPFGLETYDKKLGLPPFYAAKRIPTVHHTMGGLKIDTLAKVLDDNDKPINGLFACGEVTGDIHGANRLGGNAIVDIVVFGRLAGENAALHAIGKK